MNLYCFLFVITTFRTIQPLPNLSNESISDEIKSLKFTTNELSDQLEKWNSLYITSLESKLASSATYLATIDNNINNLQERAHIWDTFQHHVTAWNDQLATLDRKADIISKGQEKLLELDSQIQFISNIEYKVDEALGKIVNLQDTISNLKEEVQNRKSRKEHNALLGEFATRGVLSTIKMVEKKLDRILLSQQNPLIKTTSNFKANNRLNIKCNTPPIVEELLKDISAKIDVIFDRINGREANENDYKLDEEYSGGSGNEELETTPLLTTGEHFRKITKRTLKSCKNIDLLQNLIESSSRIENTALILLEKQNFILSTMEEIRRQKCNEKDEKL